MSRQVVDCVTKLLMDIHKRSLQFSLLEFSYEEALLGLRKDLEGNFKSKKLVKKRQRICKKLVKKRKRDLMFSGFGSFHVGGYWHIKVFNGVGEAYATRREDTDILLPRKRHWVTRKWHKNNSTSLNDVTTGFSSVDGRVDCVTGDGSKG
ncbi:nuclear matrix constituent protein 1-like protein [Dorcoceras hygrometricum]|uniref:Nuclear matrix constituent protein 1-like protein n=1 Tax=Dorcoceras hygrometricum TaxID=472368 RepID=A0A2Z7DGP4_9LAMI|nr:nuclear matrix constituent protein 1-like protein [Dorcoceras hygrometricum]